MDRNTGSGLREEGAGWEADMETRKAGTGNQLAKRRSGTLGYKSQYVKEEHLGLRKLSHCCTETLVNWNYNPHFTDDEAEAQNCCLRQGHAAIKSHSGLKPRTFHILFYYEKVAGKKAVS